MTRSPRRPLTSDQGPLARGKRGGNWGKGETAQVAGNGATLAQAVTTRVMNRRSFVWKIPSFSSFAVVALALADCNFGCHRVIPDHSSATFLDFYYFQDHDGFAVVRWLCHWLHGVYPLWAPSPLGSGLRSPAQE